MEVKLNWHDDANVDLNEIYNYISNDSVYYSIKTINKIVDLVNYLKFTPYMGRKIPEYNRENERELIYKSYRIIYRIESDIVFVRRIWHSSRKLPKQLIS